jgi:hypothetical protein
MRATDPGTGKPDSVSRQRAWKLSRAQYAPTTAILFCLQGYDRFISRHRARAYQTLRAGKLERTKKIKAVAGRKRGTYLCARFLVAREYFSPLASRHTRWVVWPCRDNAQRSVKRRDWPRPRRGNAPASWAP